MQMAAACGARACLLRRAISRIPPGATGQRPGAFSSRFARACTARPCRAGSPSATPRAGTSSLSFSRRLTDRALRGGSRMESPMRKRLKMEIRGAVQGVGFRPFVYRLATDLGLSGWVLNDIRGVFLEGEGDPEQLSAFRERLRVETPPRARIQDLNESWLDPVGYEGFQIRASEAKGTKTVLILPAIATRPACPA